MNQLPTREQSEQLLELHITDKALRNHCKMVAQALEAYAKELQQDTELWYQTGLLHDLDWQAYPDKHPNKALKEWLNDYPEELKDAIAAHAPGRTGKKPESLLERYLFACDEISGFLYAVSLMRPTGFKGMKPKSVRKKLKTKAFAANVSREDIQEGLELIEKTDADHFTFLIQTFQNGIVN